MINTTLPVAAEILQLHDACLSSAQWPPASDASVPQPVHHWAHWVWHNHAYNSRLWAEEDLARRTQVSDSEIALNKRAIDRFNQARNDATERLDEWLLTQLQLVDSASAQSDTPISLARPRARLNSETAGSMVDRMSIMALKIHAMRLQTQRTDVDDAHRASSVIKLQRLMQQRADLAQCFDELLRDAQAGLAYFKVYRQFKMYNDARFNPALVAENSVSR